MEPPVIQDPERNGDTFQFVFTAQELVVYEVQSSIPLVSDWLTFTNVPPQDMGTTVEISDRITENQKFYRILAEPAALP